MGNVHSSATSDGWLQQRSYIVMPGGILYSRPLWCATLLHCLKNWLPPNSLISNVDNVLTTAARHPALQIYPSKIQDGVIYVNTEGSSQKVLTKGGAETSLTGDDVYYTEGNMQEELPGRDAQGNRVMDASSWSILIATSVAISSIALVGGIVGSYLQVRRD